jgi:hypothetical protein
MLDQDIKPRSGLLAKLTELEIHCSWIPTNAKEIYVRAKLNSRAMEGCLYSFEVFSGLDLITNGNLLVAFKTKLV